MAALDVTSRRLPRCHIPSSCVVSKATVTDQPTHPNMSMNAPLRTAAANTRTPEDRHRVVVVGGGFGGLQAALHLAHLPVDVTLVDRRNFHLFQPLA